MKYIARFGKLAGKTYTYMCMSSTPKICFRFVNISLIILSIFALCKW